MGYLRIRSLGQFIRTHPKTSFLLLLAALLPSCITASLILKTDTQRIAGVISVSKEALEEGDIERTMRWVAPDFQQEGMDKDGLRFFVRDCLRDFGSPEIAILSRPIVIDGKKAACVLKAYVRFPEYRSGSHRPGFSKWRISLRKIGRMWYITEIMPVEAGGYHPEGLIDLRNRYNTDAH